MGQEGVDAGVSQIYNDGTDLVINSAFTGTGDIKMSGQRVVQTGNVTPALTNYAVIGTPALRYLKGWFSGLDVLGNVNITGNTTQKGNVNLTGHLNQTSGNATINMIYGEMYCKNDTGCGVIDLTTADVYVVMKNQTAGNNNGFTLNGASNLTAQVSGLYQANAKVSVTGGSPAGQFGMKIFVNDTGQNNCYDHFEVGADHISMVATCLIRINTGSNVSIRFDDHASPVTDVTFYASNLNLVRIGN
jgi:hypothetical protein